MARYQRFVYYIYHYDKGEKRSNVGFLRIEIRGESCKMTINIRAVSQLTPLHIYLFRHERQQMPCYAVGSLSMPDGTGNLTLTFDSSHIADTDFSLIDFSGLMLFSNRENYYATTWDDEGILIDEMQIINADGEEPSLSEEDIADMREDDTTFIEETNTDPLPNEASRFSSEGTMPSKEDGNDDSTSPFSTTGNQNSGNPEMTGMDNFSMEMQDFQNNGSLDFAKKLLSTYPKMYPFENDEILDCVRIELQDIHEFPINYWPLAHNSFLMQGYYSYLHLVFALQQKPNGELVYILGIPGICHVKQNYLAGLFGFKRFIPLRQTPDINGEFGYWIYEISGTNA